MAKVECTVEEHPVKSQIDDMVDGVVVTCGRCGHATECCGTEEKSIRRALAMLREECPQGEENFYVEEY